MLKVTVCVGSACHLKGAHEVVNIFRGLIEGSQLSDIIELQAGFCLGGCTEAVTCKVNDTFIRGVTPENASDKFNSIILPMISGAEGGV